MKHSNDYLEHSCVCKSQVSGKRYPAQAHKHLKSPVDRCSPDSPTKEGFFMCCQHNEFINQICSKWVPEGHIQYEMYIFSF